MPVNGAGFADKPLTKNCGRVSTRRLAMTEMTKPWINRIQKQLGIGCLMAACLMTASVPSSLAKKGGFRTQEGSEYIPAGTTLNVRMVDELDTSKTQPGDSFRASLDNPVVVDGRTRLEGCMVRHGHDVVSSGRLKRPASLTPNDTDYPFERPYDSYRDLPIL
jgi:hypothetical protein